MSASAKKKLRKEETAALLTEKQLKAKKEAKKLKAYTTVFVVAIAVILVAGIVIAGTNFYKNSGIAEKNTVAAVIDGYEINSVEMSYYYSDMIESSYNNWASTYGDGLSFYMSLMGLDLTMPLDQQFYSDNTTWADYFLDMAMSRAQSDYMLMKAANAEGFTISEASQAQLNQTFDNLPAYASIYGYTSVDNYLRAVYGPGSTEESYRAYCEKSALATDYYNAYSENLVIDDAAIRAYEAENYDRFSSYSYASYVISYVDYQTGGTEDENGTITYSEEEKKAAREAAKTAAESLPQIGTVEEFNAAIAELTGDAEKSASVYEDVAYESLNVNVVDWMSDSSRKAGDFVVIANESTTPDENGQDVTVISSHTAYLFTGRNDNTEPLANVRHILFNFEGGTTDENGNVTYSEEEKAAALAEAEALLELYNMGTPSEEAFAELATANTDDTASAANGGLYEDISPKKGIYVESFTNWATDPERVAGDTGIIESTYGYHVMYYVGDDELTYRDSMIKETILDESLTTWYEDLLATAEITEKDTSKLRKDIVLAQ